MRFHDRILAFGTVGAFGFAIDAGVLYGLTSLSLDPVPARLASLSVAIVATWLLNRALTFSDRAGTPTPAQFLRYVGATLFGAALNFGVYVLTMSLSETAGRFPVLAVGIGSIAAMSFNFVAYSLLVFQRNGAPNTR